MDRSSHDRSLASDAEAMIDGHQEGSFVRSIREKGHPLQGLDQLVQAWMR